MSTSLEHKYWRLSTTSVPLDCNKNKCALVNTNLTKPHKRPTGLKLKVETTIILSPNKATTGTLRYLMVASSRFQSVCLTYTTSMSIKHVCQKLHMTVNQSKTYPGPPLNTMSKKNLTLTAVHWTKTWRHCSTANWNSSEQCTTCCHRKWSEQSCDAHCQKT